MIKNPRTLEQGIKNIEELLNLTNPTKQEICQSYNFVSNMLRRKSKRLKTKDKGYAEFFHMFQSLKNPTKTDLSNIFYLTMHYDFKGMDFEIEYKDAIRKGPIEEKVLFDKNSGLDMPTKRVNNRLLFHNLLSEKIESWYDPVFETKNQGKHLFCSKNLNASKFFKGIDTSKVDYAVFNNGRGYLSNEKQMFLYLIFDNQMGITHDRQKTDIIKSQIDRKKYDGRNIPFIHSYPISLGEFLRDFNKNDLTYQIRKELEKNKYKFDL